MTPLTEAETALVDRLARTVVDRQLAVPAVLFLESSKPVAFVSSQALRAAEPLVRSVLDLPAFGTAARLLEDRDKLELLIRRIEALEAERRATARPEEAR